MRLRGFVQFQQTLRPVYVFATLASFLLLFLSSRFAFRVPFLFLCYERNQNAARKAKLKRCVCKRSIARALRGSELAI